MPSSELPSSSKNQIADRRAANLVGVFLVLFVVIQLPTWTAHFVDLPGSSVQVCALLSAIFSIALPIWASKEWDDTSFDKTLFPRKWQDYLVMPPFAVVLILWAVVSGRILYQAGYHIPTHYLPSPGWRLVNGFNLIILSPVAEEVFWRGYALHQFRRIMDWRCALFLTAAAFAVAHIPTLGLGGCITSFGYGVILGYYRVRYQALLPIIGCHVILNFLTWLFPFLSAL